MLTWHPRPLVAASTWSHILVAVKKDAGLAEGTTLSVVAEIWGTTRDGNTSNNQVTVTSIVQAPGTALANRATLEWPGHSEQLGPVTSVVEVPDGVLGVGPEQGAKKDGDMQGDNTTVGPEHQCHHVNAAVFLVQQEIRNE